MMDFPKTKYWKISPGEGAQKWNEFRENGYIAIGWDDVGDMSGVSHDEFCRRRDDLIREKHDPNWKPGKVNQVWKFVNIQEGDRVVANKGTTRLLGIGTVTGPYYYVPDTQYAHRLPVLWDDVTQRQINEGNWRFTLGEIKFNDFESLRNSPPVPDFLSLPSPVSPNEESAIGTNGTLPSLQPLYSLAEMAANTRMAEEDLAGWVRAIERKGQAILYGPPGTGKTYIAERLARHLVGGGDGFWEIVQFHPAYSYEDFIQGLRPTSREGRIEYPVVPGRFLDFCKGAEGKTGPCVLVIDEINRADLPRVFGELMYLLEYRDRHVPLATSGQLFQIPKNVRILGTMNTADRSIALVDHALRRRFAFLALYPNYDVLRDFHSSGAGFDAAGLTQVLEELNACMERNYQVGISFFLRANLADHLEDIWRTEIEPYLEEYFFDKPDAVRAFSWDMIGTRVMP
jgi:hypothetical protein